MVRVEALLQWIEMYRRMKKERKFFLKRLSCKISRMKGDNTVHELRGKLGVGIGSTEEDKDLSISLTSLNYFPKTSPSQFSYAEMIPGSPQHQLSSTSNSLSSFLSFVSSISFSFRFISFMYFK